MSIENNSARTLDGLSTIQCDVINVVESIEINGDNGIAGQFLTSDGTATEWGDVGDIMDDLSVSTPISYTSGTTYDGSVARTLQIADSAIANGKLENSTISTKELGTNLDALSAGSGITLTGGYNGSSAKSVALTSNTISGVALGGTLGALTINAPLTLDSGSTYDGSGAKTLDIANIANGDLANSTISGISLGSNLANLTGGSGITMTSYNGSTGRSIALTEDEISGVALGEDLEDLNLAGYGFNTMTAYNGGAGRSISLKFKGGGGITADADGLYSSTATSLTIGATTIALGATATDIDMNSGDIEDATLVDANILSDTNKILPSNVFVVSGAYHLPFDAGIFHPNDDNSYYNYCIVDSGSKVIGRGVIKSTTLEISGFLKIPRGWTATGSFLDVREYDGTVITSSPPTYTIIKVFTHQEDGTIPSSQDLYYGGQAINTENSFYGGATVASAHNEVLVIDVDMTSTSHYVGGGYLILTAPT